MGVVGVRGDGEGVSFTSRAVLGGATANACRKDSKMPSCPFFGWEEMKNGAR
jgi:hypothetical protein